MDNFRRINLVNRNEIVNAISANELTGNEYVTGIYYPICISTLPQENMSVYFNPVDISNNTILSQYVLNSLYLFISSSSAIPVIGKNESLLLNGNITSVPRLGYTQNTDPIKLPFYIGAKGSLSGGGVSMSGVTFPFFGYNYTSANYDILYTNVLFGDNIYVYIKLPDAIGNDSYSWIDVKYKVLNFADLNSLTYTPGYEIYFSLYE